MSYHVFEWNCTNPKCKSKLRVMTVATLGSTGRGTNLNCPVCGNGQTRLLPRPWLGFQYDEGSGWKDSI
jgi:hypothetical protein